MLDKPRHLLGCALACSNHEVALVLATFVIHDDDELAGLECGEGIFYWVELECGRHGGEESVEWHPTGE